MIDLKIISKEILGSSNLTKACDLYFYKVSKVIVVYKT